jgi:arabinan endo-1,5-alpha-L-arabinosidase
MILSSIVGSVILGCSGSDSGSALSGTGGDTSVGGHTSSVVTTTIGGVPSDGGSNATASTGGVPNTGGLPTVGGTAATGGAIPTGGTTSGTMAAGGSRAEGGTTVGTAATTGGTTATGGSKTTGGTTATGGSKTTAGMTSTGGTTTTGGTTGTGGATSSCAIATYDAANPPTTLTLTGNLGTHDPAVILADGVYYQFATGNGIGYKTSSNLTTWAGQPDVFSSIPAWVAGSISGVTNIWAPDISFFGGQYHLYYAVSTFGKNKSCIGHATRASLSSGSWSDHGSVICSNVGTSDNWNAIDPNVVVDDAGTPWMDFGSFWNGIMLIKLDSTGARADTAAPVNIARNSSIEAPYIIHQCGYYYLFVSFGACCDGAYDYNIRVGRSTSVNGPYVDKAGTNMLSGGGTQIVAGNSTWHAPGHNAVLVTPDGTYNIYHALNSSNANPTLRISKLVLDSQGWPVSGGP